MGMFVLATIIKLGITAGIVLYARVVSASPFVVCSDYIAKWMCIA